MRILISLRNTVIQNLDENRDSIDKRLIKLIMEIGALPILIPNDFGKSKNKKKLNNFIKLVKPNGLLLSGGEDLNKNDDRDNLENILISYFLKKNKPIFGICRGMQIISKNFRSSLKKTKLRVRKKYKIQSCFDNKFHQAKCYFRWEISKCPQNFDISFYTRNGTIWGIKHKYKKCEGWMLHPEREFKNSKFKIHLKNFFSS